MLPLSGKCEEGLAELAGRYAAWLAEHPELGLADVCFTAGVGRSHLERRAALVVRSVEEAGELCVKLQRGEAARGEHTGGRLSNRNPLRQGRRRSGGVMT